MKQLFSLALLCLCLQLSAQQFTELPKFGKVDKPDLEMTECSFDKNAAAMVLFDEGESFFKINENMPISPVFQQTEHHVRIKIFNSKGFDNANIKIRYFSADKDISVKSLSAQTYNLDASGNIVVSKVDKGSIYTKVINSRYSEKIFAFPDVKEGSVIEYKYILAGASEGVWYFQKSIPVKFSRFIIDFPVELRVATSPYVNLPIQRGSSKKSSSNYSWYAMENLPGLDDEPYMSCREDYLQRLEARITALDFPGVPVRNLVPTWPKIIKELVEDEDFGKQLKRNIPRTADLDKMLERITDPYKKMKIIHDYVRNNMAWNNYDNIWALDGVRSAWKDKKGTSGEINLILINLLKDAELNVKPVLVSTRDNGVVNTTLAGYSQFNKVMAYVQIDEKIYVLDATEMNTPSYLIPDEVMDSEGLVIEKLDNFEGGWRVLWDNEHRMEKNIFVYASLDDKGMMKGNATITSKDYAKAKLLPLLKTGTDKLKENLHVSAEIKIDSFVVTNENDESPLIQAFGFSLPASSTNDYHYFSTNLFTGLDKNPFIADERATDIFFGPKQSYLLTCNISIPEGYELENVPKNIRMITPDTSIVFIRQSSFSNNLLMTVIKLEFNSPIYLADIYPGFQEFYKKLFAFLNEKVVYKAK
jgi:hypothetical protein